MPSPDQTASPTSRVDPDRLADVLDVRLAQADDDLARLYPGERSDRQPVHTVYVPADRFEPGLATAWGAAALATVDECIDAFRSLVSSVEQGSGIGRASCRERVLLGV